MVSKLCQDINHAERSIKLVPAISGVTKTSSHQSVCAIQIDPKH